MLFGLLGQQIRLTPTTKSVTADDGDLDNDSSPEPTKQQTKKVSALYYGLVKTDKMSVLNYVSQVFDHLSQKLKFYENIFTNL